MEPNSSSAPFHNSRVRVPTISPTTPSQTHNFFFTQLLFFLSSSPPQHLQPLPPIFDPLYSQHCNDVVPNSNTSHSNSLLADIGSGYFTGGDRLFGQNPNRTGLNFKKRVSFRAYYVGSIIRGTLHLKERSAPVMSQHFDLNGLVTGTLESIAEKNYFEPISILGLSQKSGYQPTFIGKGRLNGSLIGYDGGDSLALDSLRVSSHGFCMFLRYDGLERTWCEDGKFQMLLGFPDSRFVNSVDFHLNLGQPSLLKGNGLRRRIVC
ncbi:hypothetical protein M0R45_002580 [Rubus argutus]|uniref:Uncharacterized protein n=1 Tax=Rubus argutus TaxID=59490 RepID=A0AAW1VQL1_RUBAR